MSRSKLRIVLPAEPLPLRNEIRLSAHHCIVAPSAAGKSTLAAAGVAIDLDGLGDFFKPQISWLEWWTWLNQQVGLLKGHAIVLLKTGADADGAGFTPENTSVVIPPSAQHEARMRRRRFPDDLIASVALEAPLLLAWAAQRKVKVYPDFTSVLTALNESWNILYGARQP